MAKISNLVYFDTLKSKFKAKDIRKLKLFYSFYFGLRRCYVLGIKTNFMRKEGERDILKCRKLSQEEKPV